MSNCNRLDRIPSDYSAIVSLVDAISALTKSCLVLVTWRMIVTSALIIWKALMCITGTESPVVVVLSGSMEPGFKRGDNLFLHMSKEKDPIRTGEIVVFNVDPYMILDIYTMIIIHNTHIFIPIITHQFKLKYSTHRTPLKHVSHDKGALPSINHNINQDIKIYNIGLHTVIRWQNRQVYRPLVASHKIMLVATWKPLVATLSVSPNIAIMPLLAVTGCYNSPLLIKISSSKFHI
ncbi:hypothetical protein K2173_008507 [Erythroxylum novogranatense]|uniref:Signal peptidase complex catalytic subunit SEC11 n=1 Tax=Erythroxylum novogranatense TaxID=1862640 RepID=A0AAV8SKM4_9ROSI|nr:hypothetical protein K2173_008507 [Erythroxylum novogranatense]